MRRRELRRGSTTGLRHKVDGVVIGHQLWPGEPEPANERGPATWQVLDAARAEFGERGYEPTTTESIARRVGVSQPYLFRLFPNKKAMFVAASEGCFDQVEAMFERAADGLTGEAALMAIGRAYNALLDNRAILRMQLHMWATACHDTEVRDLARRRMARLWQAAQRISGADDTRIMRFMASGMLVNSRSPDVGA